MTPKVDKPSGPGEFFAEPSRYLDNVDLRLRRLILRELLGRPRSKRILDVGCGDGSLTAQFLGDGNHVTFLDLSAQMVQRARESVGTRDDADFRRGDLLSVDAVGVYDIIVCVGVLAHVPDVRASLGRIAIALRPGGAAVVQYTDHEKGSYLPTRLWSALREALAPAYGYRLQPTRASEIRAWAGDVGLVQVSERRYWGAPPVLRRLMSVQQRHRFEQFTLESPLLSPRGYDVIATFEKRGA